MAWPISWNDVNNFMENGGGSGGSGGADLVYDLGNWFTNGIDSIDGLSSESPVVGTFDDAYAKFRANKPVQVLLTGSYQCETDVYDVVAPCTVVYGNQYELYGFGLFSFYGTEPRVITFCIRPDNCISGGAMKLKSY